MPDVPRNRILYDEARLQDLRRRHAHGREGYQSFDPDSHTLADAFTLKENVDTSATVYEIRTAIRYWGSGSADYRTSRRVWMNCKAVDDGMWVLDDDNELVHFDGGGA
jgi:hypothetical protein